MTQTQTLLNALQQGERLTVLTALSKYGCYALSQRMGDLKRQGVDVQSRMVTTQSGKHVAEYWLDGQLELIAA